MKKLSLLLAVAIIIGLTGSAMAIDLGGKIKSAGEKAARGAAAEGAVSAANSELKQYQCKYNTKTNKIDRCYSTKKKNENVALVAIGGALSQGRKTIEKSVAKGGDTNTVINARDSRTCDNVRVQMRNELPSSYRSWDYSCNLDKKLPKTKVFFTLDHVN